MKLGPDVSNEIHHRDGTFGVTKDSQGKAGIVQRG